MPGVGGLCQRSGRWYQAGVEGPVSAQERRELLTAPSPGSFPPLRTGRLGVCLNPRESWFHGRPHLPVLPCLPRGSWGPGVHARRTEGIRDGVQRICSEAQPEPAGYFARFLEGTSRDGWPLLPPVHPEHGPSATQVDRSWQGASGAGHKVSPPVCWRPGTSTLPLPH